MEAFQQSMQKLLKDLCRDFERNYAADACAWLARSTGSDGLGAPSRHPRYSNWKVVGWIESLNDLLYLVDIVTQVRQERSRRRSPNNFAQEFRRSSTSMGTPMKFFRMESRIHACSCHA